MNARRIAYIFAMMFLAALAVAIVLLSRQISPPSGKPAASVPTLSQLKAARKNKPASPAASMLVYRTNQFHWSSIESSDYRAYIANLRAVGCPESTIRDLVLTDLMKYYAGRRGQALTNGHEFKFWETDEKRKQTAAQEALREKEIGRLDREVAKVVRELLGVNYEREVNRYFVDTNADAERLKFLSEEKRDRLQAVQEKFEGRTEQILETVEGGALSASQREELKALDLERRKELAGFLSPEERDQYELTTSALAGRLREELIGFNPSESEFRQIFQVLKAQEEKYAFTDVSNPVVAQSREADLRQAEQELARTLGGSRYGDYQLSQNPDYRTLFKLAQRHELSGAVALTAFQIQQTALQEKRRFVALAGISPEERTRGLKAMRLETENAMREILGYRAFQDYSSRSEAQWLSELDGDR